MHLMAVGSDVRVDKQELIDQEHFSIWPSLMTGSSPLGPSISLYPLTHEV